MALSGHGAPNVRAHVLWKLGAEIGVHALSLRVRSVSLGPPASILSAAVVLIVALVVTAQALQASKVSGAPP